MPVLPRSLTPFFFTRIVCASTLAWMPVAPEKVHAEDPESPSGDVDHAEAREKSVEIIARETRPSLVTITHADRAGGGTREGSGFVIAEGLIATNLHVLGEARPIEVTTSEGRALTVEAVHASDRKLDLAILRVKEEDLPPLPLGDSANLPDGHPVVALGNPQGFRFSVVEGVISATRDLDGIDMIQLAIPIEPGNSGGPLLDRQGRVVGVPTLKSAQTPNIGFAMPVDALKRLIEKPNPITMDKWITVGRLSARKWAPLQAGARWRQRAGKILVDGMGAGFGGRALCLFQEDPPEGAYEVGVRVRLDDEGGAAGLAFASDEKDRHYGFYPSGGKIRLTHFDGADVFSWNILFDAHVPSYRPGEWNHLRMRVEDDRLIGFVNDQKVVEIEHDALRGGKVGLCKFRETEAEFQRFSLTGPRPEGEEDVARRQREALRAVVDALPGQLPVSGELNADVRETLGHAPRIASRLLQEKASALEEEALRLRAVAKDLHAQGVIDQLLGLFDDGENETIDLFHGALLIAKLGNPDLELESYRDELDALSEELQAGLQAGAGEKAKFDKLIDYLFNQQGFHGSRLDYYSRENSFLSAVMDDREGIPITLSVLFIELARRLGLSDVVGLPLPYHFVVQYRPDDPAEREIIDVFENGERHAGEAATAFARDVAGVDLDVIEPADHRAILVRMLRNLIGIELDSEDAGSALPYLDALLALAPAEGQERLSRAILRFQKGHLERARADASWILEARPPGIRLDRIELLREQIDAALLRQ